MSVGRGRPTTSEVSFDEAREAHLVGDAPGAEARLRFTHALSFRGEGSPSPVTPWNFQKCHGQVT